MTPLYRKVRVNRPGAMAIFTHYPWAVIYSILKKGIFRPGFYVDYTGIKIV